jgi:hypothetical protein
VVVPVVIGTHSNAGAAPVTVTVASAVPVPPPDVAVIVACPAATAVTTPDALTVATFGFRLAHVTIGLATTSPFGSRTWAVSVPVVPTPLKGTPAGVTVTELVAAATTVTEALPDTEPDVARIVAVPVCRAVTSPLALTRATVVSLLDQVYVTNARESPAEFLTVAASCCVAPYAMDGVAGLTVTVAGVAGVEETVTTSVLAAPPGTALAVTVSVPAATAVTMPVALTVAMPALLLVHWNDTPV